MAIHKCCVGGCSTTSLTHRLFNLPKNDKLRNLWMSFIVPTNPLLIGLSKEQLVGRRICEKHFDEHQFDFEGRRLRYSYPCLFSSEEIAHGVPLSVAGWDVRLEHNYFKEQDDEDVTEPSPVTSATDWGVSTEHNYFKELKVEDDDSVTKSSVAIGGADVIIELPSWFVKRYNDELVTESTQAVLQFDTPNQENVIVELPSWFVAGYNAEAVTETTQEVPQLQTQKQENVTIEQPSWCDTRYNDEVVTETIQADPQFQTQNQENVTIEQPSWFGTGYSDKAVTETTQEVPQFETPQQNNVITEQSSCSDTEYDAEMMTETMRAVQSIETPKQNQTQQNGSTVRKLGSKNRKRIKKVTEMAAESSDPPTPQRFMNKELLFNKFNLMNEPAQSFFLMQLKHVQKSKMARRFTLKEKLMASVLMKQTPEGYKVMEKMFALPNKRTLTRLYEKASKEPGLHAEILDHIGQN